MSSSCILDSKKKEGDLSYSSIGHHYNINLLSLRNHCLNLLRLAMQLLLSIRQLRAEVQQLGEVV